VSEPAPADPRPASEQARDAARAAARSAARQAARPDGPATPAQRLEAEAKAALRADAILVERITPWLFEVGTWVFGGLIAFNILLISALVTVGPVGTAVRVSITAFACGLPLTVAGMCVLRLVKDMKEVGLDDLTLQAFKDAGYPDAESYFPDPRERKAQQGKRSVVALWYTLGIALAGIVLTVTGLVAALWYMAWWVGVVALAVALASTGLVAAVFMHTQPRPSAAENEAKRRYRDSRRRSRRGPGR